MSVGDRTEPAERSIEPDKIKLQLRHLLFDLYKPTAGSRAGMRFDTDSDPLSSSSTAINSTSGSMERDGNEAENGKPEQQVDEGERSSAEVLDTLQVQPSANLFDSETFITSLRSGIEQSEQKRDGEYEVKAMGRVLELNEKLKGVVGSLSEKVGHVLKKQEDEFLSAYRAHMYNVQKELQELRNKVNDSEQQIKRDEKIRRLEEERDWYRKEALRLDTISTSMRKDMRYMHEKLESLEEDRKWLEKQLKTAKKQNKLLRAELEIRITETGTLAAMEEPRHGSIEDQDETLSTEENGPTRAVPFNTKVRTSASLGTLQRQNSIHAEYSNTGNRVHRSNSSMGAYKTPVYDISRTNHPKGLAHDEMEQEAPEDTMEYKRKIRMLKSQLQNERRTLRDLRASIVTERSERGELERFFLKCVSEVKREIDRRKMKPRSGKTHQPIVSDQKHDDPNEISDESFHNLVQAHRSNETGMVSCHDFTTIDQRRVMHKMLMDDRVFTLLYDSLFPPFVESEDTSQTHSQSNSVPRFPGLANASK